MFEIGDYVIYGNYCVCRIEDIAPLKLPGAVRDRMYYTLCPEYIRGNRIFIPADGKKVMIRPVISKEEAMELIGKIRDIGFLWITDEKKREPEYREAFRKCDCRELVKIIKTIYSRRQTRLAEGKKMTAGDEKYFHMAEDSLYGELAIALGMDREAVKEFVILKVGETVESKYL